MAAIRDAADYEHCLLAILRALGGRASRGTVLREFDRRYRSSVPRDLQAGNPPRWEQLLDSARARLVRRHLLFGDADQWELA